MALAVARIAHVMIRVMDLQKSKDFYEKGFGLVESRRMDFDSFMLVFLKSPLGDVELELTVNKGNKEPYTHGNGYGHIALAVPGLDAKHRHLESLGYKPGDIRPMGFFFVEDPDGYKVEVIRA